MLRLVLALLALPGLLAAQQPDVGAIADKVFAQWNSTHTPGCAVGVSRGGTVLLTRAYGMADLESGRPITPETILESGSVAKQFTATAVVLLARDGKLSLEDPVRKYIPELPDYGRPLTIRHLLTHTSGLREWSSLVAVQGWPRETRVHRQDDLLDIVVRQKSLNYSVGDYYSYTNSGFGLLYTIIERVSGKSFSQFTNERIFTPLGMTHTQWRDDFTRLVPGRAQAYGMEKDGWHIEMPTEDVVGPGGLLTTVGDWLIWNEALTNRTLGSAVVDSLSRRMRLNDGREISYALGLIFSSYRGVPEISHSGATAGYRTFLARYPDRGNLSIAVMCNAGSANSVAYGHALADALINDFPPAPAPDSIAVDSMTLKRYTGFYRNDRTRGAARLVVSGGRLRFMGMPLTPLRDGSFTAAGARFRFENGAGGDKPAAMTIATDDGDLARFAFVADRPWVPTAAELAALEGSYRSDEIGVTYTVKVVNDTLTLSPRAGVVTKLAPAWADAFDMGQATAWFSRDEKGRITALHLSESRMWDLVLPKIR